jgi:serine/threonine protein kinase
MDNTNSVEPVTKAANTQMQRILTPNNKFLENLSCFEVKDRLGKGAYARVHLVRHKETKKFYALKTYPKDYLTKPHRIANIRNEVGLLFEISHPNIINLHYVCETKDNVIFLLFYPRSCIFL